MVEAARGAWGGAAEGEWEWRGQSTAGSSRRTKKFDLAPRAPGLAYWEGVEW